MPHLDIDCSPILCADIDTQIRWARGLAYNCCNGTDYPESLGNYLADHLRLSSPSFVPYVSELPTMDLELTCTTLTRATFKSASRLAPLVLIPQHLLTWYRLFSSANSSMLSLQQLPNSQSPPISFDFLSNDTKGSSSTPLFQLSWCSVPCTSSSSCFSAHPSAFSGRNMHTEKAHV
jgi:hypothetical protein